MKDSSGSSTSASWASCLRSSAGPYTPGRTPSRRSWVRMTEVGTCSLPVTSTVRMNREKNSTPHREKLSPSTKAYRVRNRPRNSGSPRLLSTRASPPRVWAISKIRLLSRRRAVRRRVCSSSQSMAQKSIFSWAQRFTKRSGKGTVTDRVTMPLRKLNNRFISALPRSG